MTPLDGMVEPDLEYADALQSLLDSLDDSWLVHSRRSGNLCWYQVECQGNVLPSQGWKIHISASTDDADGLSSSIVPWLIAQGATFKVLADRNSIFCVNSGQFGATQTGKIITVYPGSDDEAARLAMALDRLWSSSTGPAVPSDLAIRPGGSVFVRYGSFTGQTVVDRFGKNVPAIHDELGRITEDVRSVDGRQPAWATPPITGLVPAVPELSASLSIGGDSYLPLMLLHRSPLGKVLLGLRLSDGKEVLLKVRRRGVGVGTSEDFQTVGLGAEFAVLQKLQAFDELAPLPVDYSCDRDFAVLVTEYVEGRHYLELDFETQVRALSWLALRIAQLHSVGFIHGDVKLANVIARESDVRLIDFELSVPIDSKIGEPRGTVGYLPPEATDRRTTAMDVYALGVCAAHVFLRIDPAGLAIGGGRIVGLLQQLGYSKVARIVRELLELDASRRPSAADAAVRLRDLAPSRVQRTRRRDRGARWCLRSAVEAGLATRRYRRDMSHGCAWKSEADEGAAPLRGVNIGSAGILLGLTTIDEACRTRIFDEDIVRGAEYLESLEPDPNANGFFTGNAGVAVALAVAGKRFRKPAFIAAAHKYLSQSLTVEGDFDLFSGSAGVLWSYCLVAQILGDRTPLDGAAHCAKTLIENASLQDDLYVWPSCDANELPFTGAAHGSAGIAMALSIWGKATGQRIASDLAIETFDRLYRFGRVRGGSALRHRVGRGDAVMVPSWCHGVAGYLWCLLSAVGDEKQLQPAIAWCVDQCSSTKSIGSPVYCHGMAGELELWRLVGKYPHLYQGVSERSRTAANVLRLQVQRSDGLSIWASESPKRFTPDLWVGFLGPATALALYSQNKPAPLLSGTWLTTCASDRCGS
jgi:hypothetical protein